MDHYSPYVDVSPYYTETLMLYSHLYIIHSAILYEKDISFLTIKNCVHLYEEMNKNHVCWNNIENNYVCSLGTTLMDQNYINERIQKNNRKFNPMDGQKMEFHISIFKI